MIICIKKLYSIAIRLGGFFYSFFVVYTVTLQIHDCPARMVILFLAVVMLGISSWDTQIVDTRVFCFKSPISLKLLQV